MIRTNTKFNTSFDQRGILLQRTPLLFDDKRLDRIKEWSEVNEIQ